MAKKKTVRLTKVEREKYKAYVASMEEMGFGPRTQQVWLDLYRKIQARERAAQEATPNPSSPTRRKSKRKPRASAS